MHNVNLIALMMMMMLTRAGQCNSDSA